MNKKMSETNKPRRLFLLAGYDAAGVVDASLEYYVRELHRYGDVIVHMDNDNADKSIDRLSPYVLHGAAVRHGEYDFGSYKRAWIYAHDNNLVNNYDFVYMLNDSVYGPLYDLGPALIDMESRDWSAFGLVCNPNRNHPHIQSWFTGMRPAVFAAPWFDEFMRGVTRQSSKGLITKLYEQGFTNMIASRGLSWGCLYTVKNRGVYNNVKSLYRRRMPFMKKVAFPRHNGRLGGQILYVLNRISPAARDAILENARRTWGDEYITKLLTRNPFKIFARGAKYALTKTLSGRL